MNFAKDLVLGRKRQAKAPQQPPAKKAARIAVPTRSSRADGGGSASAERAAAAAAPYRELSVRRDWRHALSVVARQAAGVDVEMRWD